jgi:hypothetical protein
MNLAWLDEEIDAFEGARASKGLGDIVDKQCLGGGSSRARFRCHAAPLAHDVY